MKILFVADEVSPFYYDYYAPGKLDDIDLIISCGDLKPEYLSFLVTLAHAPLYYVHGNHDGRYAQTPPEGCESIDGKIIEYNGLRIMGLGGSRVYSKGPHQYSEKKMRRRIFRMRLPLWCYDGVDLIVTHAPVRGYGDAEDRAHLGFSSFLDLLDKYAPKYLVHGHVHARYEPGLKRERQYKNTRIINACERYILEIDDSLIVPHRKYLKFLLNH